MIKKYRKYILGCLVILLVYAPHFQEGIWYGLDSSFHFSRIFAIAEAMKNGIFPVKLHNVACYGYGYGVGFFYSNALLYIPALIMNIFKVSLLTAYKIFILLIYILIFLSFYYSAWKVSESRKAAFWTASMFLFSSKVMETVYLTMSVGEFTGMVFAPLAISGIYIFLVKDESPLVLCIGFIGLIFTHVMSTFLSFIVCFVFLVLYSNRIFNNQKKMLHLGFSIGIVIFVTSIFWLPMFEQMKAQILKVKAPWTISQENVQTIRSMLGGGHGLGYMIICSLIISTVVVLYMIKMKKDKERKAKELFRILIIVVAIMYLTTCYSFWYFMNSILGIKILQFPYRLYAPITILILFILAMTYAILDVDVRKKDIIMFVILCIGFFFAYKDFGGYYMQNESTISEEVSSGEIAGLGGGEEWLPINTNRDSLQETEVAVSDSGDRVIGKKLKGFTQYVFTANLDSEYYEVPYIWYKGYHAEDSNGNSYEISQDPESGLVRVNMPEKEQGTAEITVCYSATKYQKLSYFASIIGVIVLGIYYYYFKKKN